MQYRAPLRLKRPSLLGRLVILLTSLGWQYSVTPTRSIRLASIREQVAHVYSIWSISRQLIKRRRAPKE